MLFLALLCVLAVVATAIKVVPNPDRMVEIMLPMRDGVELHTQILFPRDYDGSKTYPVIMDRSPYGYSGLEWIVDVLSPFGFIAIGQDMRGTEKSQGNFTMWQSDKWDSEDLGNWVVSQDWSNGEVFTLGASADGIGSVQTVKAAPSWLKGQYIVWASMALYDTLFPHGAYKQETVEDWLYGVTMPNPAVVYDNIATVYENEAHTAFWGGVELDDQDYSTINYPTAMWAGWYDLFLEGNLVGFEGYNSKSDPSVRGQSKITIDAGGHCLEAGDAFGKSHGRTALVLGQLFEVMGIHPVRRNRIKNVSFYVMSSGDEAGEAAGRYFTTLDAFPKPNYTKYYLHGDGSLSTGKPAEGDSKTSFKYDPSNPVPTIGGNNLAPSIGGSIECGPRDQSSLDGRADIVNFETPVATEELAMTGSVTATLYVSSDAIDTDFTVKITDVYPNGEAHILVDNAFRMRWREGGLQPVYMKEGDVYKIDLDLWTTSYVLAPGHALRVSVSSSNWPRFSVNPNNGLLLKDAAYPGENITAINTVHHDKTYASYVTLPIVHKFQIPKVNVLKEMQESYPQFTEEYLERAEVGIARMARKPYGKKH